MHTHKPIARVSYNMRRTNLSIARWQLTAAHRLPADAPKIPRPRIQQKKICHTYLSLHAPREMRFQIGSICRPIFCAATQHNNNNNQQHRSNASVSKIDRAPRVCHHMGCALASKFRERQQARILWVYGFVFVRFGLYKCACKDEFNADRACVFVLCAMLRYIKCTLRASSSFKSEWQIGRLCAALVRCDGTCAARQSDLRTYTRVCVYKKSSKQIGCGKKWHMFDGRLWHAARAR